MKTIIEKTGDYMLVESLNETKNPHKNYNLIGEKYSGMPEDFRIAITPKLYSGPNKP